MQLHCIAIALQLHCMCIALHCIALHSHRHTDCIEKCIEVYIVFSIALHLSLHCISIEICMALHCIALHSALNCIAVSLQVDIALHCIASQCIGSQCIAYDIASAYALHCIALHSHIPCIAFRIEKNRIALHWNALERFAFALHCISLHYQRNIAFRRRRIWPPALPSTIADCSALHCRDDFPVEIDKLVFKHWITTVICIALHVSVYP